MVFTAPISKFQLRPGSVVTLTHLTWQNFEAILQDLGEQRGSRITYSRGVFEIMVPLPDHERSIVLISDIVKILLRHQQQPWESLRSTTFKKSLMEVGVEPDDCFYIAHHQAVIGKDRLDLAIDPPPDLAIESDYTSKTRLEAYVALGVPELWIYENQILRIYVLREQAYLEVSESPSFPSIPLGSLIPQTIAQARQQGTSQALSQFESQLLGMGDRERL